MARERDEQEYDDEQEFHEWSPFEEPKYAWEDILEVMHENPDIGQHGARKLLEEEERKAEQQERIRRGRGELTPEEEMEAKKNALFAELAADYEAEQRTPEARRRAAREDAEWEAFVMAELRRDEEGEAITEEKEEDDDDDKDFWQEDDWDDNEDEDEGGDHGA